MGPVFRAYDAERERLVAVKLFKLDLPPERVHQLVAALEDVIGANLTHPAMAVPRATGITGVTAYLAQDYVAAESLDLAVREYGAAPPTDALRVVAQLAGALDFGAVMSIGHGALHPRDVLLSADETRMTGLGVARALETIGVAVPVRRPYTAPERVAGGAWDRRADIFSLAALAHEMLWARRITGSGSHVVDALTELPGSQFSALKDAFARALADDPHDRFETALDFADALKHAFPDVTLTEPEPKKAKRPKEEASAPRLPLDHADVADLEPVTAPPARRVVPPPLSIAAPPEPPADFDLRALDMKTEQPLELKTEPPARIEEPTPEPPPISMIEESRSAVWPLVAAVAIGLGVGFAGGYFVGTRDRTTPAAVANATTPGRESTEVAVAEPPKAVPPTEPLRREQTPPPAPPQTAPVPAPPPASTQKASAPPAPVPQTQPQRVARPTRPPDRPASSPSSGTSGRFVGRLTVESKPTGARVYLDGRLVGTTPLALDSVTAGSHVVRLERDGYRRWSSSTRVVAAESNRVTASLER